MKRIFTKRFRQVFFSLLGLFIVLFLFRLGYGYTLKVEEVSSPVVSFDYFESSKQNYASTEYHKGDVKGEIYSTESQVPASVDQKYEKIADVRSETYAFDEDEKYVRNLVEENDGIIQYERKYGNDGERKLQLQVGVPPENFDTLYERLIGVGIVHSKEIIKNDKTNEYLELNARKASLEKTLASLVNFKEKNGRIDEFINLENRILEIEEQLQNLGVNLGDFDESNEFCTIRFALSENVKPDEVVISFYHRVKVAFEWTVKIYFRIVLSLFFVLLGTYLALLIGEKAVAFARNRRGS